LSTTSAKLTFLEKAGYGCGDLASVLFWQTLTAYLLYFYTDVFGIAAAAAGTMIMVTRILDGLFDPVIGMVADRTSTRFGKYRPYILWGAVPLAVSAVFAFTTPPFGEGGRLAYAYLTLILFMLLYSTVNIPYSSLRGVISPDPTERTSASSFKFVGAYVAGAIVSATALPLAKNVFGQGSEARGWPLTMAVYGVAACAFFFITFSSTRERVTPPREARGSIAQDLGDLFRNVPWILMLVTTILMILFVAIRTSVTTHYFKYYVSDQHISILGWQADVTFVALTSAFSMIGQASAILGVILVPWFARLVGKKNGFMLLFVAAAASTGAYYFLGPQDLGLIFFLQVISSLTGGPLSSLIWAMYADTADYSEWKNKRRATGLVFSASILSQKVGWAVGIAFAGILLGAFGFKPNVGQNPEVLHGLKMMMSVIPAAAGVLAILVMQFYKLDEPTMKRISDDLAAARAEREPASV
jgi:GPH family glycoside/pentoside/hexuronide:cation symporter